MKLNQIEPGDLAQVVSDKLYENDTYLKTQIESNFKQLNNDVSNALRPITSSDGRFSIVDGNNNAVIIIEPDGVIKLGTVNINSLQSFAKLLESTNIFATNASQFFVSDANNNTPFFIDSDGTVNVSKLKVKELVHTEFGQPNVKANIYHIIGYGQSLSAGYDANPVISTVQNYNNVMFKGGVFAAESTESDKYSSFSPLVEGGRGETPLSAFANCVQQLIIDENGVNPKDIDFKFLCSCCGVGGAGMHQLIEGASQNYFQAIKNDIDAGFSLAQSQGKTYNVPAFQFLQGEAYSGEEAVWMANLISIQQSITNYVKSKNGQTNDVMCLMYQTTSNAAETPSLLFWNLAIGDLSIMENYTGSNQLVAKMLALYKKENFVISAPIYALPQGLIHFTNYGSAWWGALTGRTFKRLFIDNNKKFNSLQPISHTISGNTIELTFNNSQYDLVLKTYTPLTGAGNNTSIDESYVDEETGFTNAGWKEYQRNYGFSVKNAQEKELIQSVSLADKNRVKIVCTSTPLNLNLEYALRPFLTYRFDPNKSKFYRTYGGLRDNSTDKFNVALDSLHLYNWCASFRITLSNK